MQATLLEHEDYCKFPGVFVLMSWGMNLWPNIFVPPVGVPTEKEEEVMLKCFAFTVVLIVNGFIDGVILCILYV